MPNLNYATPGNISRITANVPGGLYRLLFAPIEDIDWSLSTHGYFVPQASTGTLDLNVVDVLSGKSWKEAFVPRGKTAYREEQKTGDAGAFVESVVDCVIPFMDKGNLLQFDVLKYYKYVVFVQIQDNLVKIMGNKNDGATLSFISQTGEGPKGIPGTSARFTWISEDFPPIADLP